MLRVEALRAGYRTGFTRRWREVLQGVTFRVARGSVTGYLGVNGAGKTTTIKVLVGINRPTGGSVEIGGHRAGTPAAQRRVGYFPEAPFFYDGLSARELLDFFGRLGGVARAERSQRAERLLEEVGLADAGDLAIREYSKGMRQRLGLAQALIHEPELLVLDEPLDGLDPMGRLHLRRLIAAQGEKGTTVFFSSHVLSDVEAVCDQLVVLDGGTVAYSGPTDGISDQGEPSYEIRLDRLPEHALAALEEAAASEPVLRGDGSVEVVCVGQDAADAVVDVARDAGGRVLGLQARRPTLEEVFLERFGAASAAPAKAAAQAPAKANPEAASSGEEAE
jgi:ABC-2 type transport system ATP-binding protein